MRANGIAEHYCTGDADPYDKFLAWARTVPYALRNPLYHWTHLELQRYFGIDQLLDENTAPKNMGARQRAVNDRGIFGAWNLAEVFRARDLHHRRSRRFPPPSCANPRFWPFHSGIPCVPSGPGAQDRGSHGVQRLDCPAGGRGKCRDNKYSNFLEALEKRHKFFHLQGCSAFRITDWIIAMWTRARSAKPEKFSPTGSGKQLAPSESAQFASFLMVFFGHLDAKKEWTKQLHLGAYRDANMRMLGALGPNTGFDSIGDWPQAASLAKYLDRLEQDKLLPKLIIYNANPTDNYVLRNDGGEFAEAGIPGKMQFGGGWWFLDQKDGIEAQVNALSNSGLLSRFVGMLTDSRSFMSYPRHEYFRRVLCNLLGSEIESGLLPDDKEFIGRMIRHICFDNAAAYFGLSPLHAAESPVSAVAHTEAS